MRHRLLASLGQGEATISQLAAALDSNKGNIAHHLRILVDAGLVLLAGTRQVRGGTEQYYRLAPGGLPFDDIGNARVPPAALVGAQGRTVPPGSFLTRRVLRLTPEHARQLAAVFRDLADQPGDGGDNPRYDLLISFSQAAQEPPDDR
jgi:DNA-binding transcriptional ArsR family regulator